MKRYIFLLLLVATLTSAAQQASRLAQANQHYMAQEFDQAVELYEQILTSGQESAQIYYNLGNAYYKKGVMVKAILNYERAKLLAPQNDDIDFNLTVANQFVVDRIEQLPQAFFVKWRNSVINSASANTWAWLSAGAFLIFLVLLGSYFFSRSLILRKLAFWSAILIFVFSALSFTFAAKQNSKIKNRDQAIIQCQRVSVKSSPALTGTDLFLIHEGLKVQVSDSLNTWKEIILSDGNKGWLPDSCLVII